MIESNTATDDTEFEVGELLQKNEFGSSLKQARESAGLTAAEVAERLLISVDIIKAIDSSNADALPAATFTQGYIRSYARILNISADHAIKAYNEVVPSGEQALTPHSVLFSKKDTRGGSHKSAIMLIGAILLLGLMFWAYENFYKIPEIDHGQEQVELTVEQVPEATLEEEMQSPGFIIDETIETQTAEEDASLDEQLSAPVAEASISPTPETVQPVQRREHVPSEANDELFVIAKEDSWCEITDANNRRLTYRVVRADEKLTIKGAAPFRIVLGNASQVELEVNNKPVKFGHLVSASGKIANLTLDSDASVKRYRKP